MLRSDAQRDLSPLAKLTQLETLDITDGQISDLRPLSGLARLRELAFHFCAAVSDLRPLAGLAELEKLTFNECERVTDLRPLSKLERLRRLDLTDCFQIANVKPLAKLKKLELLVLANTDVTDTSALNGLPKLRIRFGEEAEEHDNNA